MFFWDTLYIYCRASSSNTYLVFSLSSIQRKRDYYLFAKNTPNKIDLLEQVFETLEPNSYPSSGVIPDKYPKKAILRNLSMARSYSLDPEGSGSIIELPSPRYSSLQEADGLGNKSEHPSYLVNHLEQRISKPEPIETTRYIFKIVYFTP